MGVFASGEGSNLAALLERFPLGADPEVALVLSDRPSATALQRARSAGVPAHVEAPRGDRPDAWGQRLLGRLADARVDLVVLAGFLRKVPPEVVTAYTGRMINVHPALLPDFGGPGMHGRRVHEAVLAAGVPESGASVHFVDEEYDRGPVIARRRVPVEPGDTPETLARRVLEVEHELLPDVVAALAAGRVRLLEGRVEGEI